MLKYAIVSLVLAIVAAVAGFWLSVALIADIAKILFVVFVIGCVYFLIRHFAARRV